MAYNKRQKPFWFLPSYFTLFVLSIRSSHSGPNLWIFLCLLKTVFESGETNLQVSGIRNQI